MLKINYLSLIQGKKAHQISGEYSQAVCYYFFCTYLQLDLLYMSSADTLNPTAYITAATSFTSTSHVPINISFSEPCGGEGGFRCSSVNACNVSRSSAKALIEI